MVFTYRQILAHSEIDDVFNSHPVMLRSDVLSTPTYVHDPYLISHAIKPIEVHRSAAWAAT